MKNTRRRTMGRLIDADDLLVAMNTWDKFGYDEHNRLIRLDKHDEEYVPYVHYDDMIYCINSMPTAYYINNAIVDDFQKWLKTQIVGVDDKTKEILVVVNDRWQLAVDVYKGKYGRM